MPKIDISKADLQDMLVAYAAHRLKVPYPLNHSIKTHGEFVMLGGDESKLFTVTVEHLPNVIPLPRKEPPYA